MKFAPLLACTIALAAAPASAASFAFTASGNGLASAGLFTTTNTTTTVGGREAYTVTGISGSFNGAPITSLLPVGTAFGGERSDNLLFTDPDYFTLNGAGFTVAGAALDYNFWVDGDRHLTRIYTRAAGVPGSDGDSGLNGRPLVFSLSTPLTFNFMASREGQTASGTITTTSTTTTVDGRQAYTIVGISGSFNGAPITSLLPAGTAFGGERSDNLLFAEPDYFTLNGVGFTVAGAALDYNFWVDDDWHLTRLYTRAAGVPGSNGDNGLNGLPLAFTLQLAGGVPEPATWALLILGFGLTGAAVRRRKPAVAFA